MEPVELFRLFQIDLAPALHLTLEESFELELAQYAGEAREAIAKPCHVLNVAIAFDIDRVSVSVGVDVSIGVGIDGDKEIF